MKHRSTPWPSFPRKRRRFTTAHVGQSICSDAKITMDSRFRALLPKETSRKKNECLRGQRVWMMSVAGDLDMFVQDGMHTRAADRSLPCVQSLSST